MSSGIFTGGNDEEFKRLREHFVPLKSSFYDSFHGSLDASSGADVEENSEGMGAQPQQGCPYFHRDTGDSVVSSQRTVEVDKSTWDLFRSRSFGRRASCEFVSTEKLAVQFDSRSHTPILTDTSTVHPNQDENEAPKHLSIFGLPVLSPTSPYATSWLGFMSFVDLTFTAFMVPFLTAFISSGEWDDHHLESVDFISGAVFLLDIFIKLHIGFVIQFDYHKKIEMRGKHVAWFYFRYGGAWIDIASVIPSLIGIILFSVGTSVDSVRFMRYIRMIRIVRLLRALMSATELIESGGGLFKFLDAQIFFLMGIIYCLAVLVNFLGCLLFFLAAVQDSDLEGTWLEKYDEASTSKSDTYRYILSTYWAITTLTTVGFGDVTPKTAIEMVVMGVIMITQIMIFGFLIGTTTEIMVESLKNFRQAKTNNEKLHVVQHWLTRYDVPVKVVQAVKSFYSHVWIRRDDFNEQELLDELPTSLRSCVVYSFTAKVFKELPLFRYLKDETVFRLAGRMNPVVKYPNEDITEFGKDSGILFILEDGTVHSGNRKNPLAQRSAPDVFGISSLLPPPADTSEMFNWKLRAYSCCRIWKLSASDIYEITEVMEDDQTDVLKGIQDHLKGRVISLQDNPQGLQRMFRIELGRNISEAKALILQEKLFHDNITMEDLVGDGPIENPGSATRGESSIHGGASGGPSVSKDVGNMWEALLKALRKKGTHGAVNFFARLNTISQKSLKFPVFCSLVRDYIDKSVTMDISLSEFRQGEEWIAIKSIMMRLYSFQDFGSREKLVISLYQALVHDSKDVMVLLQSFSFEQHPDIKSGLRSKSNVVSDVVHSFSQKDNVSLESFITYHRNVSLCIENDDGFKDYLNSVWKKPE